MKINPYLNNNKAATAYNTTTANSGTPFAEETSAKAESGKILKDMGLSPTSAMQSAYSIYKTANNEQPSRGMMQATQNFLEKAPGSTESKLLTVQTAAAKGIEITEKNLGAVHTALNESASETLAINELTSDITVKKSAELTPEERRELVKSLPAALKERVYATLRAAGFSEAEVEEVGNRLLLGEKSEAIIPDLIASRKQGELSELLSKAISGDGKALAKLNELLSSTGVSIKLEKAVYTLGETKGLSQETLEKIIQKILKASSEDSSQSALIKGLSQLITSFGGLSFGDEAGKDAASREDSEYADYGIKTHEPSGSGRKISGEDSPIGSIKKLLQEEDLEDVSQEAGSKALEETENYLRQLAQMVDQSIESLSSAYGSMDLNHVSATTKTILMTEVTEKILAVKAEFDQFKSQALEKIDQVISSGKTPGLGEAVSKIADKLDRLIMQSDVTLYTDMKSERKLMGLSSELQEISAMSKTHPQEALEKLKDLRKKLENLLYQPSKEKIIVTLKDEASLDLKLKQESIIPEIKASSGAKGVLDLMRALGLNHEPELMDQVFATGTATKAIEESKDNFKQILLKLTDSDLDDQQHLVKSVEKGLSQLTGQQLLNKPEPQNDTQSLFFNVPLNTGDQQSDMKLYVKARKNVDKMDWENCSMYFLVDLKQYGETGIRINANQRQLSVSISNASSSIMDVIEPFAKEILSELKEIGYNPGEIKFVPLREEKSINELPKVKAFESGKGSEKTLDVQGRKGFEWQV